MSELRRAVAALRPAPNRGPGGGVVSGLERTAPGAHATVDNVDLFHAAPETVETVAGLLGAMGFTVTGRGPLAVSFAGPPSLFEHWFGPAAGGAASGEEAARLEERTLPIPEDLKPHVERVTLSAGVRLFGGR